MEEDETLATRSRRSAEERLEAGAADREVGPQRGDDADVTTRTVGRELVLAVTVMIIGVGLIVYAGTIREGSIPDPITSQGLPRGTGVLLILFGALITARTLAYARRHPGRRIPSTGGDDEPGFPSSAARAFAFLAGSALWAYLVDRLGYFIVTPVILAAGLAAMGIRSWLKIVLISVGFTIVAWLMFYEILGIQLPLGLFESSARRIGIIA